jgi:hypothetical protein
MSVPIFLSYMDYCQEQKKAPEVMELLQWKQKYNNR